MTLYLSSCRSRNDLPGLLTDLGLIGVGVEVGTHRGDYARIILERWRGVLHCVDPWDEAPADYQRQAALLPEHMSGGPTREDDYQKCLRRVTRYGNRCVIHKTTSAAVCGSFPNAYLDFVYLDGNHEPPHPYEDIVRWWPKLKLDGVMAGHDFLVPNLPPGDENEWGYHVQSALRRWNHPIVFVMPEDGVLPWSWYMFKET